MNPESILQAFESKDPQAIHQATGAILRSRDRDWLHQLLPHVPRMREIVDKVDLGGAFLSNNASAKHALNWIENAEAGACQCTLYGTTSQWMPENEARNGNVEIESTEIDRKACETRYRVRCLECGTHYRVLEIMGWHLPQYQWRKETTGNS
ncbi:MAG: hypothetical protein CMO55_03335 [Verrucomicrobiales bacterium]|nr:hypothetical protein [Verrucomicrobiales bacterium]